MPQHDYTSRRVVFCVLYSPRTHRDRHSTNFLADLSASRCATIDVRLAVEALNTFPRTIHGRKEVENIFCVSPNYRRVKFRKCYVNPKLISLLFNFQRQFCIQVKWICGEIWYSIVDYVEHRWLYILRAFLGGEIFRCEFRVRRNHPRNHIDPLLQQSATATRSRALASPREPPRGGVGERATCRVNRHLSASWESPIVPKQHR